MWRRASEADPGRRQLARPRDALGRPRRARLHPQRQRLGARGRRREALRRLGHELGAARLRARRPRDARRDRGRRRARDDVRRPDRSRGRARGGDRRRGAVGRDGAPRLLRHRGSDERGPARARLHATRPHPQVLRLLPRPLRRAACERRLRPGHARDPFQPGRPDRHDCGHRRHDLQRSRRGGRRGGALRRRARGDHRRAGRREHGRRPACARASSRRCARSATPPGRCSSSTR